MILTLNIRQGLIFEADASQSVLPSLPHYHGTYREQVSVRLTGVSEKPSVCPSEGRGLYGGGGGVTCKPFGAKRAVFCNRQRPCFYPKGDLLLFDHFWPLMFNSGC